MESEIQNRNAINELQQLSRVTGIDIHHGRVRRTSSRFCFGVEHGDYNGTELFGIGTDRFIWFAYKPNNTDRIRLFSGNFPDDGIIEFKLGEIPEPKSPSIAHSWARFPFGVEYVLRREGVKLSKGFDGIVYGNIPGGGMSRSASLTINLILSILDANNIKIENRLKIADWAQAVENDYIGSPCGQLDQIMILFAKEGMGTHYNPKDRTINYVPLGKNATKFHIVCMDTGTVRPGLEKSTYKIRKAECEQLVEIAQKSGFDISSLGDIKDLKLYNKIKTQFDSEYPHLCSRMKYIYEAQHRFYQMIDAWKAGDIETVGQIFRDDGIGLHDDYNISGPELETMCDIARKIPGVLGERMLGGGDKGAAGAITRVESTNALIEAIKTFYPHIHPAYAEKFAVHTCRLVEGVAVYDGIL
ncbi:MAG: hypothetical protein JW749_08320 [Sedimentisphaerales bacterium]|nr:hypothetical protein [Sedimentisphaerales bacterium]